MLYEIELKAHIDDPEALKKRLSAIGTYKGSYEKDDCYWTAGTASCFPAGAPSGIRVRNEKTVDSAGKSSARILVTCKIHQYADNVEVNDEREFEVSSGAAFGDLLGRLGLKPGINKRKKGWSWAIGAEFRDFAAKPPSLPVLAELSEVSRLGWFIELEILSPVNDEKTVAGSQKTLFSLLETLGIEQEKIEKRPYTQMLQNIMS
jgi:predicted adenylyl cyclase CyaB